MEKNKLRRERAKAQKVGFIQLLIYRGAAVGVQAAYLGRVLQVIH